jgi:hypothetical protein
MQANAGTPTGRRIDDQPAAVVAQPLLDGQEAEVVATVGLE